MTIEPGYMTDPWSLPRGDPWSRHADASTRTPRSFCPPSRNHNACGASLPSHVPGVSLQQGASGVYMGCAATPSMSPMPQMSMMGTAPNSKGSFGQSAMNVSQMHAGMNFPQGNFAPESFHGSAPMQNMSGNGLPGNGMPSSPINASAMPSMMPGTNVAGNAAAQPSTSSCGLAGCPLQR